MQYQMRTSNSCGPDVLACATGFSHDTVDHAWGIDDIRNFVDVADTPWNHFATLKKMNIPWKIRNCSEIITGKCGNLKTIILIHSPESPLLLQHWVLLDCVRLNGNVDVHWGNGKVRSLNPIEFIEFYTGGKNVGPQCAYEIGIGSTKLTWYQRLYAFITREFI